MTAVRIDGARVAAEVRAEVRAEVDRLVRAGGPRPGLGVLLVGDDGPSQVYVRNKTKACDEAGIFHTTLHLPPNATEADVGKAIEAYNRDARVHGILVQLPLPAHLDEAKLIATVDPRKDVDGFHPENQGRLLRGNPRFVPATPLGIQTLLLRSQVSPEGKHVVIVGRGNTVGKPLAVLLLQKARGANATVTVCHAGTTDLSAFTRQADILVSAVGKAGTVRADMVKRGAAVVDVGINQVPDPGSPKGHRLVGDVDYDAVAKVAGWITPVPGGVGPMTIASLLTNTLSAAKGMGAPRP
ncbi:MAG: bifunctional 5,10-methylenetetrahydrofolate dehydrogenase/5,10-methenyltetrahydrofolate cyclohydrolase [Methanobacteriota archaeon]